MNVGKSRRRLRVAIIGGGPGGLGAAIELSRLPFVDWNLYEKKAKISETGGGISLQPHTWRLLELNGTAQHIGDDDFFRHIDGQIEQRRNGRNGRLLHTLPAPTDIPSNHQTCRLARSRLQAALLRGVDQTHVHVGKRLKGLEQLSQGSIRIFFEDGIEEEVDLLVGADGIRSLIRSTCFPGQNMEYNGQCVYRTIVSKAEVKKIHDIPWAPVFWKHVSGLYVYTCPLGDDEFEVTARIRRPRIEQGQVSWGQPFKLDTLLHEFTDFCQPVQDILRLAAKGDTQEFALISGPRLRSMANHGNIAFIGDAAHALCGNFGAGAGFALEDVYTLAKSLAWADTSNRSTADALNLFDSVRSPHYKSLYGVLDKFVAIKSALSAERLPIDEDIETRVQRIAQASESWMYYYDVGKTVKEAIEKANKSVKSTKTGDELVRLRACHYCTV